jgi:hypothetical protein
MDGRPSSNGKLERGGRLGASVWVWYLTTGSMLAITRVALFVWMAHRVIWDTRTDSLVWPWLYPEGVVSIFWNRLVVSDGTEYYLAWGWLVTVGSFVLATPILLVGWLRRRRTTPALLLRALFALGGHAGRRRLGHP